MCTNYHYGDHLAGHGLEMVIGWICLWTKIDKRSLSEKSVSQGEMTLN